MIEVMKSPGGRIGRLDIAIAVLFSMLGVLLMVGNVQDSEVQANALAIPLFFAVTVPLLWRRVAPIAAVAATLVGCSCISPCSEPT